MNHESDQIKMKFFSVPSGCRSVRSEVVVARILIIDGSIYDNCIIVLHI